MYTRFALMVLVLASPIAAQNSNTQQLRRNVPLNPSVEEFLTNRPSNAPTSLAGDEYKIGRDDLIDVSVFEVPDLSGAGRVSASGIISLPLVGTIEAAGKTTQEIEKVVEDALRANYVNDPHVTVFVREYASQPVSVLGAVKLPGIYQIKGQKFLLDMLAMAQGLDTINAGRIIQVIRRQQESADGPQTITVDAEDLFQNGKTELNIPIKAGDVINVLQAGSIFVVGEVMRPGEFVLHQGRSVTAGQAVAWGGGVTRNAKKKEAVIIRVHRDAPREEIPVNIEKIYEASIDDVPLLPNDILFVPASKVRAGMLRALDATINVAAGRLIYSF